MAACVPPRPGGSTSMSEAAPADGAPGAPPRRRGLVGRLLLPLLMLVVGAGAGVAGTLALPGLLPGLLPAGEKKPVPRAAPIAYLEIDHSFTANLTDTGRFLQLRIAVSTLGGDPVLQAVERHRLAIIAAVLAVLGETGEGEVVAPGGRDALARRMRAAINDVLQRKSGIAGIDDVFIVTFVLQ